MHGMLNSKPKEESLESCSPSELRGLLSTANERIALLQWQVDQLTRAMYGRKSERFVPTPGPTLPGFGETEIKRDASQPEVSKPAPGPKRKRNRPLLTSKGRFPENLPREDGGKIEVAESERPCPDCGTTRVPFSEEISERLVHRRKSSLVVLQYRREVCRCPQCKDSVIKSPAPKSPIPGVQVESSVLAHILSEKFEFGIPFYRVEERLKQSGFPVTRTTLCEYQQATYKLLKPLESLLIESIKSDHYTHADESKWNVHRNDRKSGKKRYLQSWCWILVGASGNVLVKYSEARTKDSFWRIFGSYVGTVICDGEDHYDYFKTVNKTNLGRCNAHARRKFEESLQVDKTNAAIFLRGYGAIYRREAYIKRLQKFARDNNLEAISPEKIISLRRRSLVIMEHLKSLALQIIPRNIPTSPIVRASKYFIRYFDELSRFCTSPFLPIDNNTAERMIRKFVIGRKAWMFSSSEEGAHASALLYSLVLTCINNGISAYDYLNDVINQIGVQGNTNYAELLPLAWKAKSVAPQ